MKKIVVLIIILSSVLQIYGQQEITLVEGKVTYITLQNIYVRFEKSGVTQPGDTIFIRNEQGLVPLFIAESVSSTSCVGKPIVATGIKVEALVFAKVRMKEKPVEKIPDSKFIPKPQDTVKATQSAEIKKAERVQKIRGRLSASSYSSFSGSSDFNQRMRYTFSMTAENISGSRFSTDSYILFTHKLNHWDEVQSNVFNALKIYSLAVNYDATDRTRITFGRKINTRIASIGAIDGLQAETSVRNFTFGAVVGSNPDYSDYSFNPKLFEYGAFLSHDMKNKSGQMVNSFAFFQQTNRGNTDRRFAYFQQENSLLKNLNLFLSCELDLYALKDSIPTNTVSLTSLYFSVRYRFSRKLSFFGSYDARKNVIYYETFKNYLDQMLEDATRQGYQFRVNYNPGKFLSTGISGGYRFRKNDLHPTLNANGFISFPRVPWINTSVNLSTNWLKTSYVDGLIYGIRIDREIVPSKLSSGLYYRVVDYLYTNSNTKSLQHMAELELSWQITKKIALSANYDGTFEKVNLHNSIYLNLIKRF